MAFLGGLTSRLRDIMEAETVPGETPDPPVPGRAATAVTTRSVVSPAFVGEPGPERTARLLQEAQEIRARSSTEGQVAVSTRGVDDVIADLERYDGSGSREYSWIESLPPNPRDVAKRQAESRPIVRRPLLGLVPYSDRYATLEVIARGGGGDGTEDQIQLFNSTYRGGRSGVTSNFIVQNISETDSETITPTVTHGDWYLSDSGATPKVFQVQGVLLESRNFPWLTEWRRNYDAYIRGRQCLVRKAMVYLSIDDTMYVGYILQTSLARAAIPSFTAVSFNFQMLLRDVVDLRAVQLFPDGPRLESAEVPEVRTQSLVPGERGEVLEEEVPGSSLFALNDGDNLETQPREIVRGGEVGSGLESFETPVLEWTGTDEEAALRIDVETLVAVARRINASAGRRIFDLQNLRNGYIAGRRADYELMGETNPDVLQKFGFPSRYQTAVDAQTRAVQEEYREGVETAVQWARDRISGISWL